MSSSNIVRVGEFSIKASDGHIYLQAGVPDTYDYVPWNIIGALIAESDLNDIKLIDVGANIGDSLAHFRRFSSNKAICVEPSPLFFGILEENATQFGDVLLINKLLVPKELTGRVAFSSGSQTGFSRETEATDQAWHGDYVSLEDLGLGDGQFLVKTDTDGFDATIIAALLDSVSPTCQEVPIIFFEGPSSEQMLSGDLAEWMTVINRLQMVGYELLFLTNRGVPYIYAGKDTAVAKSAIVSLQMCYPYSLALCHYFDVIAVHESVGSELVKMQSAWPVAVFPGR